MGFLLPCKNLYGLGPRTSSSLLLKNGTYTLWSRNREHGSVEDTGEGG